MKATLLTFVVLAGCAQTTNRFEYTVIDSQAERKPLAYGVYTPPGWDNREPLPVVLLLHGAGEDATSADRAAVVNAMDEAMVVGHVPPAIVVTPQGELGFWVNWYDGSHRWRDWVLEEVVPDVRSKYPTLPGQEGLHLMGVSMGGGGGMQMWLDDPSRFGSATILSAPILDEGATRQWLQRFLPDGIFERVFGPPGGGIGNDPYAALQDPEVLAGSRLVFGAARNDKRGIEASNSAFHSHLRDAGTPHTFVRFSGGHGWTTWARVFPFALCRQLSPACELEAPSGWDIETL